VARVGLEPITDLNGGESHGFVGAPKSLNLEAGVREDSTRAYCTSVDGRLNLKIIKCTAKRIAWADSRGRQAVANGVEYVSIPDKLVQI
jgi:choline dehydrogenase